MSNNGEYLAMVRQAYGLSQREMATLMEVSNTAISEWERGKLAMNTTRRGQVQGLEGLGYDMIRHRLATIKARTADKTAAQMIAEYGIDDAGAAMNRAIKAYREGADRPCVK